MKGFRHIFLLYRNKQIKAFAIHKKNNTCATKLDNQSTIQRPINQSIRLPKSTIKTGTNQSINHKFKNHCNQSINNQFKDQSTNHQSKKIHQQTAQSNNHQDQSINMAESINPETVKVGPLQLHRELFPRSAHFSPLECVFNYTFLTLCDDGLLLL